MIATTSTPNMATAAVIGAIVVTQSRFSLEDFRSEIDTEIDAAT
jgi:hypothetical protein